MNHNAFSNSVWVVKGIGCERWIMLDSAHICIFPFCNEKSMQSQGCGSDKLPCRKAVRTTRGIPIWGSSGLFLLRWICYNFYFGIYVCESRFYSDFCCLGVALWKTKWWALSVCFSLVPSLPFISRSLNVQICNLLVIYFVQRHWTKMFNKTAAFSCDWIHSLTKATTVSNYS